MYTQCHLCKLFSNGVRIEILLLLRTRPYTVSELIRKTALSQSALSQHLAVMRKLGIVAVDHKGKWVSYSLKYPEVMKAYDIMKEVMKKLHTKSI